MLKSFVHPTILDRQPIWESCQEHKRNKLLINGPVLIAPIPLCGENRSIDDDYGRVNNRGTSESRFRRK